MAEPRRSDSVDPAVASGDLLVAKPTPRPRELRAMLLDRVVRDLHGPLDGPEEELDGRLKHPRDYILGALAPEDTKPDAYDQMEDGGLGTLDGDDDDDDADAGPEGEGKPRLQPTSIGLTVFVPDTIDAIAVTARWGRYVRFESETATSKDGNPLTTWHRESMGGEPQRLTLRETTGIEPLLTPDMRSPGVAVTGRIRKRDGFWAVTLFLKNGQERLTSNPQTHWLYQVELELASVESGRAIYSARAGMSFRFRDDEERESAMLYRAVHQFAMGHGCAIHAEPDLDRPEWARTVRTVVVPRFEVPATVTPDPAQNVLLDGIVLDMKTLSEIPDGGFAKVLSPLVRAYHAWIATREQEIPLLGAYEGSGTIAMERARLAADRIERGIALLDRDPLAARAFRFANAAMHQQRIRGVMVREGGADPDTFDEPKNRSWRLFQLAFVLVNLPALTDLHDPDRTIETGDAAGAAAGAAADLLWFPTGGGKTEAYLGLTAYTIAIRRLQGVVDGHDGTEGVGVIMRYTLRLLTLQQFQRAAALMCACEVERRKDPQTWGSAPIRIGLWVGGKMTPNRTAGSERAIQNAKLDAYTRTDGDPYQLTACPWCGAKIERGKHLEAVGFDGDIGRTFIYCGDKLGDCPFSKRRSPREGLPVLVVDEEIYRHPPALLIATVDKFAQMPWNGAI